MKTGDIESTGLGEKVPNDDGAEWARTGGLVAPASPAVGGNAEEEPGKLNPEAKADQKVSTEANLAASVGTVPGIGGDDGGDASQTEPSREEVVSKDGCAPTLKNFHTRESSGTNGVGSVEQLSQFKKSAPVSGVPKDPKGKKPTEKNGTRNKVDIGVDSELRARANILDEEIVKELKVNDSSLATYHVTLGTYLAELKDNKYYKLLDEGRYGTYGAYQEARGIYGLTRGSHVIKIGKAAEDIRPYLEKGIGGSQLIEYAKACPLPEQIGQLLGETWNDEVAQMSARKVEDHLRRHVEGRAEFVGRRKESKSRQVHIEYLTEKYAKLPENARDEFVRQVNEWADELHGSEQEALTVRLSGLFNRLPDDERDVALSHFGWIIAEAQSKSSNGPLAGEGS